MSAYATAYAPNNQNMRASSNPVYKIDKYEQTKH